MDKQQLYRELNRLRNVIAPQLQPGVDVVLILSASDPEQLVRHVVAEQVQRKAAPR